MTRIQPIALNHDYYSGGSWGSLVLSHPASGSPRLLAPVFPDRYAAELFGAVCKLVDGAIEAAADAALELAGEITEFHRQWDETQDGLRYPTDDGRYPSAEVLARWFLEARQQPQGEVLPWAA